MKNKPSTRQVKPEEYSIFLYEKKVRVRKNSLVQLGGVSFWVDPPLSGKRVIARYNPQDLTKIEIWVKSKKYQYAYPFDPNSLAYRLCRQMSKRYIEQEVVEPVCDVLDIMANDHHQSVQLESGVEQFIQIIEQTLSRPLEKVQKKMAENFWEVHGPFCLEEARSELERFIKRKGKGLHIDFYLEVLQQLPQGN